MKKKTYIESKIDKFLKDYEDKNINIGYGDKGNKNKFDTENITKSLKKLHNKFINFDEFNKFMDNVVKFEYYKSEKKDGSVSTNQKKDLKSDSDTSKKGEGLKISTNKQMLNRLPILLGQIEAGNNSIKLKNEARQILYSLYRPKVLTKTVYNNLIKSIRA